MDKSLIDAAASAIQELAGNEPGATIPSHDYALTRTRSRRERRLCIPDGIASLAAKPSFPGPEK